MPLESDYEFGKAAVVRGFLNQEQLEECVEFLVALERVGSVKRLWDVAVRRGFMRPDQVAALRSGEGGDAQPSTEGVPVDAAAPAEKTAESAVEEAWDISLDAEVVPVSDARSQLELDPNRVNTPRKDAAPRAFVPGDMRLDCVNGSLKGKAFTLDKLRTVIGRDPKVDVVVDEVSVSREHAALSYEQPWLVVRDLKSRNGVYLNGRKVEEAVLRPGEQLRVGTCVFEAHEVIPDAEIL